VWDMMRARCMRESHLNCKDESVNGTVSVTSFLSVTTRRGEGRPLRGQVKNSQTTSEIRGR
jgi:hypothetical protein